MAEDMPGDRGADGRFVGLADGDMHVVEDGRPGAPALLLIHGSAGSTAWWYWSSRPWRAPATLSELTCSATAGRPAQRAVRHPRPRRPGRRRAGPARRGPGGGDRAFHGCMVATALASSGQKVAGLALIDMGPSLDAASPDGLLVRLLLAQFPGRLLWRLRSEATIRKAMRSAFTRPVDIPGAIIEAALGMTHRALAGTARGSNDYIRQQSLPGPSGARGPGSGDLRHRGRAVSLLVGCRLPCRSRRPRRVAARRGDTPR